MNKNELNIHQISGSLVADPELKIVKDDKKLLLFRVVYFTPQTTDNEGSHANFVDVEVWGKLAEIFGPLLAKGMKVLVMGDLVQKRFTDKNGAKREKFLISADSLTITDLRFQPRQLAA